MPRGRPARGAERSRPRAAARSATRLAGNPRRRAQDEQGRVAVLLGNRVRVVGGVPGALEGDPGEPLRAHRHLGLVTEARWTLRRCCPGDSRPGRNHGEQNQDLPRERPTELAPPGDDGLSERSTSTTACFSSGSREARICATRALHVSAFGSASFGATTVTSAGSTAKQQAPGSKRAQPSRPTSVGAAGRRRAPRSAPAPAATTTCCRAGSMSYRREGTQRVLQVDLERRAPSAERRSPAAGPAGSLRSIGVVRAWTTTVGAMNHFGRKRGPGSAEGWTTSIGRGDQGRPRPGPLRSEAWTTSVRGVDHSGVTPGPAFPRGVDHLRRGLDHLCRGGWTTLAEWWTTVARAKMRVIGAEFRVKRPPRPAGRRQSTGRYAASVGQGTAVPLAAEGPAPLVTTGAGAGAAPTVIAATAPVVAAGDVLAASSMGSISSSSPNSFLAVGRGKPSSRRALRSVTGALAARGDARCRG